MRDNMLVAAVAEQLPQHSGQCATGYTITARVGEVPPTIDLGEIG